MGGLYAILTMAAGQRTRELAIRVALGTREASLRWVVLAEAFRLVAAGRSSAAPPTPLLASRLHKVTRINADYFGDE